MGNWAEVPEVPEVLEVPTVAHGFVPEVSGLLRFSRALRFPRFRRLLPGVSEVPGLLKLPRFQRRNPAS